jgi:hypothetical protein
MAKVNDIDLQIPLSLPQRRKGLTPMGYGGIQVSVNPSSQASWEMGKWAK